MEALDNPSYFRLGDDPDGLCSGGPRARDMAPEERKWLRRSSDHEAVVLGSSTARYYNLGAIATLRRHSFSATLRRSQSVSFKKNSGMLDITIISSRQSEAATLWVNYLTSCFQHIAKEEHTSPFKLAKINAEDVLEGLPVDGASGSRLQIVLVCPALLEVIRASPGVPILASMLQPSTVLAMLFGITAQALDSHPLSSLFRFEQWRKHVVKDQDPAFVGDFLGIAMDILRKSLQLQQAMAQLKNDNSRANFSVLPKKIKIGQNKLLVLLNDPINSHDKMTITVDKSGTKIDVPSFKRRNPYTLQFSMPSSCLQTSTLVTVSVERNGRSLGHKLVKCESKLRELDQLLKSTDNPLVFMCQALGITTGDKDQLDTCLVSAFKKNLPPNFNLLNVTSTRPPPSKEEYPTLLHFAARYGLEKLCWQLLDCPGGEPACQLRNIHQQTPAEIAENSGHGKLAHALHGYLQMTELSSMYSYLKGVSEKPEEFGEGNYLLPRPIADTYLVPPKARPLVPTSLSLHEPYQNSNFDMPPYLMSPKELFEVPPSPRSPDAYMRGFPPPPPMSPMDNYQSPPHARPFTPHTPSTPSSPFDTKFSTYLHMHSPASDSGSSHFEHILGPEKKYASVHPSNENLSIGSHNPVSSSGSLCSKSPEDELLEIINDFKNNVFTITEVEKLVEAWRNRNDVQQSFREKQEQLNLMRQEYERIQQKMKEQMKRATPFERIKKFFSRKPKHESGGKGRNGNDPMCNRPVSSLSLHSSCSSSSSGRMSTASGASLGDSGTHSDPEEKKSENGDKSRPSSSSDAVYPEPRLQSVREQVEHLAADDYVHAFPTPPRSSSAPERTIVEVHRSDILNEEEEDEPQQKEDESEMEILEQSERLLKDMVDGLPYLSAEDDALSPPESVFVDSSDPLTKDIEVVTTDVDHTAATKELLQETSRHDYINVKHACLNVLNTEEYSNVAPFPPLPPKSKYKNVIL